VKLQAGWCRSANAIRGRQPSSGKAAARFAVLIGWLDHRERDAIAYLMEENRILRAQLRGRRLRLTDEDRRRLAGRAFQLGRRALRQVARIVTPIPCCDGPTTRSP
jgi:hypothetical protein